MLGFDLERAYVYLDVKTKQPSKKTSRTRNESKMLVSMEQFFITFFHFCWHMVTYFSLFLKITHLN